MCTSGAGAVGQLCAVHSRKQKKYRRFDNVNIITENNIVLFELLLFYPDGFRPNLISNRQQIHECTGRMSVCVCAVTVLSARRFRGKDRLSRDTLWKSIRRHFRRREEVIASTIVYYSIVRTDL